MGFLVMTPLGHCRTSLTCAYSFLSSVRTDDSAGHTGIRAYLEVWAEPFVDGSDVDGFAADGQLVERVATARSAAWRCLSRCGPKAGGGACSTSAGARASC